MIRHYPSLINTYGIVICWIVQRRGQLEGTNASGTGNWQKQLLMNTLH